MYQTIVETKSGDSLLGTVKHVRIVYRTGFYSGLDFDSPVYTVAINNTIQANYHNESEAMVHYLQLVGGQS